MKKHIVELIVGMPLAYWLITLAMNSPPLIGIFIFQGLMILMGYSFYVRAKRYQHIEKEEDQDDNQYLRKVQEIIGDRKR